MATVLKNLSDFNENEYSGAEGKHFGIVVSDWNTAITNNLLDGAVGALLKSGAKENHLYIKHVPGTFELPLAAQKLAQAQQIDAVITLGCVIQGETRHFDFICDAAANGIMQVALKYDKPVIFGVLTTQDLQQAIERSGGKHGNKGVEAALTAIKMLHL